MIKKGQKLGLMNHVMFPCYLPLHWNLIIIYCHFNHFIMLESLNLNNLSLLQQQTFRHLSKVLIQTITFV